MKPNARPLPRIVGTPPPLLMTDAVDARAPALIIPVPNFTRTTSGRQMTMIADSAAAGRVVIVHLDADALQRQFLQPLVAKYFGQGTRPNTSSRLRVATIRPRRFARAAGRSPRRRPTSRPGCSICAWTM
jgi:hypothetical protein